MWTPARGERVKGVKIHCSTNRIQYNGDEWQVCVSLFELEDEQTGRRRRTDDEGYNKGNKE